MVKIDKKPPFFLSISEAVTFIIFELVLVSLRRFGGFSISESVTSIIFELEKL